MVIDEKMLTLSPDSKAGVNISKRKCDQVRQAVIKSLDEQGEMTFTQMGEHVRDEIESEF